MLAEIFFCLFIGLVIYVYFGYPSLLTIMCALRSAPPVQEDDITPTVAIIIAARNEAATIGEKIKNCMALDYPQDYLEIIVVSDSSTDNTNEIVRSFADRRVKLVTLASCQGKSSAQNRGVAETDADIILFTDANAMLRPDAVQKIVCNFADNKVGCVSGRVMYLNQHDTTVTEGEGLYWRYELFLRTKETELGNFAMGSGPIMALRRSLFSDLDPDAGEDFVLPIKTVLSGYRVIYAPDAISEETLFQDTPITMLSSKMRIIIKDLRGLLLSRAILNPFRYPIHAWGMVSHKLLRWLVPYFLIAILCLNLLLHKHPIYNLTLILQLCLYVLALLGYLLQKRFTAPRIIGVPFSFCVVNLAALIGVARFALGEKSGKWEPVRN